MTFFRKLLGYLSNVIPFEDINVKEALLASSDINPDGTRDITYDEAKSSSITGAMLKAAVNPNDDNTDIVSFEELQYFTGLDEIPTDCFKGCTNLEKIKFPNEAVLYNINNNILSGCAVDTLHLEDVTKLKSAQSNISSNSKFGSLPSLKKVYINSMISIEGLGFTKAQQPNIEKIIVSSIEQWCSIYSNDGRNVRPSVSEKASLYLASDLEHPVTAITTLDHAIQGITTVPTIFEYSFHGLLGLTSITIGAQNTEAKKGAFRGLPASVTIYDIENITKVGEETFYDCKAQGLTNIPSSVTAVYENTFRNSSLLKVESTSLTTISGHNSFSETPITSVILNNIKAISGTSTFFSCTALTHIELNGLTSIPQSLCRISTSITTASFTSAQTINGQAFLGCTSLTTIEVPNVTILKADAFGGCTNLTEYNSSTHTGLNINLTACTEIGRSALSGVTNLTCPTDFPNLTKIGNGAFGGCIKPSANYVILSYNGVVEFTPGTGFDAAANYSLTTFGGYPANPITKIYVPDAYYNDYQSDTNWSNFLVYNPNAIGKISDIPA